MFYLHEVAEHRPFLFGLFKHYKSEPLKIIEIFGSSLNFFLQAIQILQNQPLPLIIIIACLNPPIVFLIDLLDELFVFGSKIRQVFISRLLFGLHIVEFVHHYFVLKLPQYLCHSLPVDLVLILDYLCFLILILDLVNGLICFQ
jgi:hypothetical protein